NRMNKKLVNLSSTAPVKMNNTWLYLFRDVFMNTPEDLPEIILILSLVCIIGAFLNMHLKDFLIPLPVILFLIGCGFETLSFTSFQVQRYVDSIQWMNPHLFFGLFTPVIIFNVAFDMDVYMLRKLLWQILLITIPGFAVNYILILWYLHSVNKLVLKTIPWLLFSAILVSSDPMLTATSIRDLGLSRSLTNLINGESLITSVISLTIYSTVININAKRNTMTNLTIVHDLMSTIWAYGIQSFLFGILNTKLIQLWVSTILGDDINHISLIFSVLYFIFYVCELTGMSGIFTLAIMGLFLNSTSFKPGDEALLLEFWNCLSFVAFLMVFTFIGLLIPTQTYLYISFSDLYYSLNIYFTLIVLRLLIFLLMSPILCRLGHGFTWRSAFIMVWSEMKGWPNITMALLFAYSDLSLSSDWERSQILFHGVSVCLITLMVNRLILPAAVAKLGLHDVTSTKYKSVYYTFQHFQELTKSTALTLKFDKDLANADWSIVEKAILLQNPYALNQEITEHQKVKCPDCNKEIDETLNIEAMELANRRLLSAQIASYQRQYRNETLSQSAVQVLVGAAGSFGEKKGEHVSAEIIRNYSESKKFLSFMRKLLLNWAYNIKKDRGSPSRYWFFRVCNKIVFTDEFENIGNLVLLMNIYPIMICWIVQLNKIYQHELKCCNYYFLAFYILEALFKMAAMRKAFISQAWNLFELGITLIGILEVILIEISLINYDSNVNGMVIFMRVVRLLRILRILKLVTPKLLQIIDKRMSHELSFQYAILKGYVQGEVDVMNIIDQIANSTQIKQVLLERVMRNMEHAMKELGYLEYDHPEITITMKTKEEIHVMLNMAREIVKTLRSKGIIHKVEGAEIYKLIMAKKVKVVDYQSIIKPLTVDEILYHIPWLDKNEDYIHFIQEGAKIVTFDCGNNIFEEGDEPKGIYIILSGMVQLKRTKTEWGIDRTPLESEGKGYSEIYTDCMLSGEIIGEINCLTDEPMKYSAICKTVVETYFIPKHHLEVGFEMRCPLMKLKMWQKIGFSVTVKKIKERLSYEDWNYKLQLKLCNVFLTDIPLNTKTDIYDESITHVILVHGSAEDCQLRKIYKAPFLIPVTCHQIQGNEPFTKVMMIQTTATKRFRWNVRKYVPLRKVTSERKDK
uniref:Solute carrier family 9 member C1 n=1 Tax=Jaculus jaculus TaxID=51337 RepID=A0A8C5NXZ3_JACJA